jgi:hypothetical protein
MSTQTVRAGKPDDEPMTPVIIKSGGGGVESKGGGLEQTSRASSPVEIQTSSLLPFAETALGPKWKSSQSKFMGRITSLTITDGGEQPFQVPLPSPPDKLVSVTIKYGLDQLIVMESGDRANNGVVLVIASPQVAFTLPPPGELPQGDWTGSTATFKKQITSVTTTVGSVEKDHYDCTSPDVTVTITFDQNPG